MKHIEIQRFCICSCTIIYGLFIIAKKDNPYINTYIKSLCFNVVNLIKMY